MLTRRDFLLSSTAAAALATAPANALFPHGVPKVAATTGTVWMEAPAILAFQVSDKPALWGNIVDTGSALRLPYELWAKASNPRDGSATENAMPVGVPRQFYKFDDLPSTGFLDRLSLRPAANYSIAGGAGLTVTHVWFRQEENNQLGYRPNVGHGFTITQTITIYLKLASAPANGNTYTITNPTAGIAPITFTYDDKATRAGGIRTSAGGHKPNDPLKIAYLCSRIPGNTTYGDPGTHGSIDFGAAPYSLSSFDIVDGSGTTVYTGSVSTRCGVTDVEKCAYFTGFIDDGTGSGSPSGVAGNKLTVTAITDGYIEASATSTAYIIGGASIAAGTFASAQTRGTTGGVGVYTLSGSAQLIGSEQMYMTDQYSTGIDVADTSQSWTITAVRKGTPTTITFAGGHGFATGDRIRFRGISGMTQLEGSPGTAHAWIAQTVTVIDANTITVPINSAAFRNLTTGTYDTAIGGVENQAYKTFNTNRAGATVYGLDYSNFLPKTPGNYYIHISGWGISDAIPINTAQWAENTSLHHKGLYNLRHGIALDGRAGFTRGISLLDGHGGLQNNWSNLPAIFSTEAATNFAVPNNKHRILSGIAAYTVNVLNGGTTWQPWGTASRAVGSRPGHQDAGDNDDPACDHAPAWANLAWVFEAIQNLKGAASCNTPFSVPLSSAVCDPTLFADTDSAAPLWHEMIWWAESLRTMQNTDSSNTALYGSVPGGYGIGHFSQQTANAPEDISHYHGTDPTNATNHGSLGAFLYAPDHLSGIFTVQFFAKIAIISYQYGFNAVGDAYKTAATLLYNWCQAIATNTKTRDAYYKTHLGLLATYTAQFGWTSTDYNSSMSLIATHYATALPSVQGTMWRLSGINSSGVYPAGGAPRPDWTDYGQPADTSFSVGLIGKQGGWDYQFCSAYPNFNAAHATYVIASHWTDSFQKGGAPNAISTKTSFATSQWASLGGIYADFNNIIGHMQKVFKAASPSTSPYLKALEANFAFQYGANLRGRQYMAGQGPRPTVILDHNDSIRLGQSPPVGIVPFSFATTGWGTYSLGTFFNLGVGAGCDNGSTFIASNTTGTNETHFGSKKMIEPWPQAQAAWEWSPQNYDLILICEFTQALLLGTLASALWCHAWDGSSI